MTIVIHPDDWTLVPVRRQVRYINEVRRNDLYSLTTDHPEMARRGEIVGRRTLTEAATRDEVDVDPYRGYAEPPCGIERWEHHLSQLLGIDDPCVFEGLAVVCGDPGASALLEP